jgi:lipopolysaccharide biosynthesis glycosyltransferase
MEEIIVVLAADNKYVIPLTVTLYSLLSNLSSERPIVLYVIDGGIEWWNKIRINQSLSKTKANFDLKYLNPKKYESQIRNLRIGSHITRATYYRLLLPYLLDENINQVIYLDSDILIIENLSKLWNTPLKDRYLLAVQDMGIPYVSSLNGLSNYQELEISPEQKYFNAGVLFINLQKWRADNIGVKVIDFIKTNREKIRWFDQEGLNAIVAGKWGELDPRWNQMAKIHLYSSWEESPFSEEIYQNVINNPYIIHFSSQIKPWYFKVTYKCPYEDLFFEYLDHTAWQGWRPKEALKNRLKRYWQKIINTFK